MGLSWGVSSALPRIRFLASAYSASRWAKDFTCGEGRLCVTDGPREPLLVGRFKMRICGGGAAGRESSWIMIVFIGERPELLIESLPEKQGLLGWGRSVTSRHLTSYMWLTFLSDWCIVSPPTVSPFPKIIILNLHKCFPQVQARESTFKTLRLVFACTRSPCATVSSIAVSRVIYTCLVQQLN